MAARYTHPDETSPMRPDVGTQAQFRKKKPPKTYQYDSSLSPALAWDGQNGARELGEWLIAQIEQASARLAPHEFAKPREFQNSQLKTHNSELLNLTPAAVPRAGPHWPRVAQARRSPAAPRPRAPRARRQR